MITLGDIRSNYRDLTGLASQAARQLAFAGIAVVWVFRGRGEGSALTVDDLLGPLALFALALLFDLLQYVLGASAWHRLERERDTAATDKSDASLVDDAPDSINRPAEAFYRLKIGTVLVGYAWLVGQIIHRALQ